MAEIQIRRFEPSDIDDLISLFRDTVRRIARRDYTQEQVMAWAPDTIDCEARALRHSSKPTWIAEISGTMVGFTDLEPDGHLDCMYVHADYQGRGVASRLLAESRQRRKRRASRGSIPKSASPRAPSSSAGVSKLSHRRS